MNILVIVVLVIVALLALWLLLSQCYMRRRRPFECDLIAFLTGYYERFDIDPPPGGFERDYLKVEGDVCLALYVLKGAPDAPVCVFMPGTAVHAELYAELLVALHGRGFTIVAFDPRGHGRSGRLRGYYTVPQLIEDSRRVAGWARQRFGKKVAFFGTSQGGIVALYVAATEDPNISTVICNNFAALDGDTILQIAIVRPPKFLVPFLCWVMLRMRAWAIPVAWFLPLGRLELPPPYQGKAIDVLRQDPLATLTYSLGAVSTFLKTEPAQPFDRITTPVMLISTTEDEVFPVPFEQRLFDQLTCEKQFLLLDHLAHLMILKPPVALIDSVEAWARTHAP